MVVDQVRADRLPLESFVSALTLAELAAGTHMSEDPQERARRQERLQHIEATVDALPFDGAAARAYGRVAAAVMVRGRKPRGRRALDLLIAASAAANGLALYTRDPEDFAGLEGIVEVIAVA